MLLLRCVAMSVTRAGVPSTVAPGAEDGGESLEQRIELRCVPAPASDGLAIDRSAHLLRARRTDRAWRLVEAQAGVLPGQAAMLQHAPCLPLQVVDDVLVAHVQYESVVADHEAQTRRLLEYCGLPWEDACLRFHETERAIRTASSEQVRRPIYTSSIGVWRHYTRELAGLTEVLEPILSLLPPEERP